MISANDISNLEHQTLAMLDTAERVLTQSAAVAAPVSLRVRRGLQRMRASLVRPAAFALVGEFNSGKSSLCNRLMELDTLPTDLIATTRVPTRLYWSNDLEVTYSTTSGRLLPRSVPVDAAD